MEKGGKKRGELWSEAAGRAGVGVTLVSHNSIQINVFLSVKICSNSDHYFCFPHDNHLCRAVSSLSGVLRSTAGPCVQVHAVPLVVRDVQRAGRGRVHHLPVRTPGARQRLLHGLPGRLLHGQEAQGVHALSARLQHLQLRHLPHLPARLRPQQEGQVRARRQFQMCFW